MTSPGAEPELENNTGATATTTNTTTNNSNSSSIFPDRERPGSSLMINRWPKQETLALLKIRQDMDGIFRDSNLKHPLWEEVSRKLGELGFQRSAKKCKEKFENVNKYYKRTCKSEGSKAAAAAAASTPGKQEGKSYRFFTQLEALQTPINSTNSIGTNAVPPSTESLAAANPIPKDRGTTNHYLLSHPGGTSTTRASTDARHPHTSREISESHESSSDQPDQEEEEEEEEEDDDDDDGDEELADDEINGIGAAGVNPGVGDLAPNPVNAKSRFFLKKRKRTKISKMFLLFEGLLKKILDKQEQMQMRLLEALEKRDTDRMIREEAWRTQEMARMSRENDLRAQERSSAADRDTAIIAFLEKVTGQIIDLPHPQSSSLVRSMPSSNLLNTAPLAAEPVQSAPPLSAMRAEHTTTTLVDPSLRPESYRTEDRMIEAFDPNNNNNNNNSCGKRWEKPEVLALIKLHSDVHSKFTANGPKAPLWEDISSGMAKLGYPHRSAKRCKEKWENINKYFKKACKEPSKKRPRPDNAKTCPYFHELNALYKKGMLGSSTAPSVKQSQGAYTSSLEHMQNVDDDGRDNEASSSSEEDHDEEDHTINGDDSKSGAHVIKPDKQETMDASKYSITQ